MGQPRIVGHLNRNTELYIKSKEKKIWENRTWNGIQRIKMNRLSIRIVP